LIQHFGRSRRRAQLQKNSREAGGYNYRDAKRKGGKRGIGGGNAIDAWEWEGSAVSSLLLVRGVWHCWSCDPFEQRLGGQRGNELDEAALDSVELTF